MTDDQTPDNVEDLEPDDEGAESAESDSKPPSHSPRSVPIPHGIGEDYAKMRRALAAQMPKLPPMDKLGKVKLPDFDFEASSQAFNESMQRKAQRAAEDRTRDIRQTELLGQMVDQMEKSDKRNVWILRVAVLSLVLTGVGLLFGFWKPWEPSNTHRAAAAISSVSPKPSSSPK